MKTVGIVGRLALAACVIVTLSSRMAMADPVTPGTLSPITLNDGGTIGGSITFNDTLTQVLSWNIVETGGTLDGFTFTPFTYTNANSNATFFNNFAFGGRNLATLDIRTPDYNSNTPGGRALGLFFDAIPTSIPAGGLTLEICGVVTCNDPLFTSIRSGEIVRDPTTASPFQVQIRNVNGGYFTVSDPPLTWDFNFSAQNVLIPNDGSTGGGGGGPAALPEPSSMILAAFGIAGVLTTRRQRAS